MRQTPSQVLEGHMYHKNLLLLWLLLLLLLFLRWLGSLVKVEVKTLQLLQLRVC